MSPPKTFLKWFNGSIAVKDSELGVFALSFDLIDFHIFSFTFLNFSFCFALLFVRFYFLLDVTNRLLFIGFLFLKNTFLACLNSFLDCEHSLSNHLFDILFCINVDIFSIYKYNCSVDIICK